MHVSYKNSRQEEFSVLMQRMETAGLRPADVARRLNKTPGAISQYLSGKTNPSETVLSLFRRIVEDATAPEKIPEVTDNRLREQLDDLQRLSPPDYEVAKTTISLLHQKVSSEIEPGAKRILRKVSASVQKGASK